MEGVGSGCMGDGSSLALSSNRSLSVTLASSTRTVRPSDGPTGGSVGSVDSSAERFGCRAFNELERDQFRGPSQRGENSVSVGSGVELGCFGLETGDDRPVLVELSQPTVAFDAAYPPHHLFAVVAWAGHAVNVPAPPAAGAGCWAGLLGSSGERPVQERVSIRVH